MSLQVSVLHLSKTATITLVTCTPIRVGTHRLIINSSIYFSGVVAVIFAFISVSILMRWFKNKEVNSMRPTNGNAN